MLHAPKLSQVELDLVFSHFSVMCWDFWHRDCVFITPVPDMKSGMLPFLTHPSVLHRDLIISWFRLTIMAQVPHDFVRKLAFL